MQLPLYQVDAFAEQVFGGNPAAVVPLDNWLSKEKMQQIAAENNLSETAFFVEKPMGFYIRWFTPTVEVDLCGHATLATAHVLFEHLGYDQRELIFDSKSGQLIVSKEGEVLRMNFPADQLKAVVTPPILQEGLGTNIRECYRGKDDYLAIIDKEQDLATLTPNFSLIKQLPSRGIIVSAPGDVVDFVSRGFFPQCGIDEDPVTGSAHCTLTPYWGKRLGKTSLVARQISKRGGTVQCRWDDDRVHLGGRAVTYLKGIIEV